MPVDVSVIADPLDERSANVSYRTMSSHASSPNLWCSWSTHHSSRASDILIHYNVFLFKLISSSQTPRRKRRVEPRGIDNRGVSSRTNNKGTPSVTVQQWRAAKQHVVLTRVPGNNMSFYLRTREFVLRRNKICFCSCSKYFFQIKSKAALLLCIALGGMEEKNN